MKEIILAFIGAGIGGVSRFLLGSLIISIIGKNFPWATMTINLIGSFLMGFLFVLISTRLENLSPLLSPLILVGILGGFTTFSSFSLETLKLIQQNKLIYAISYVTVSTLSGVTLCAIGYYLAHKVLLR